MIPPPPSSQTNEAKIATYRVQLAEEGVITTLVTLIATPATSPDIREHALRVLYNISLEGTITKISLACIYHPPLRRNCPQIFGGKQCFACPNFFCAFY